MQVAIITGAGSGIGLGTAKKLHEMGMAIVGIGRDLEKLKHLEETLADPPNWPRFRLISPMMTRRSGSLPLRSNALVASIS